MTKTSMRISGTLKKRMDKYQDELAIDQRTVVAVALDEYLRARGY